MSSTSTSDLSTEAYEAKLNAEMQRMQMGASGEQSSTGAASQSTAAESTQSTATAANENDDATATSSADASATSSSMSSSSSAPSSSASAGARIEEIIEKNLDSAIAAKQRGNQFYARQQYDKAIEEYTNAIQLCPDIPDERTNDAASAATDANSSDQTSETTVDATPAATDSSSGDQSTTTSAATTSSTSAASSSSSTSTPSSLSSSSSTPAASSSSSTSPSPFPSPSVASLKEHLSVFYSNRAAAYLMTQRYRECIDDTSASISLHPRNPKCLSRRAKAHEAIDQLQEAVDDLKQLLEIDPSDVDARRNLARVEVKLHEKNEKMKAEMMGKLKDFGNTILGKFGLSLDNFKATKDPTTGSYNISFGK